MNRLTSRIAVSAGLVALIATVAYASGFQRIPQDNLKLGNATATTKAFEFDSGDGTSNAKLQSTDGDNLAVYLSNVARLTVSDTAVTTTVPLRAAAGSASAPAFSLSADTNTGLYSVGADQLGISTGGTLRRTVSTTLETATLPQYGPQGLDTTPTYSFTGKEGSGMYEGGNVVAFSTLGARRGYFSTIGLSLDTFGTVGAPPFSWDGDSDTGMYRAASNDLGFSAGGVLSAKINNSGSYFLGGTGASPGISFISDSDTGIYNSAANEVAVAVGGANMATFSSSGLSLDGGGAFKVKTFSSTLASGATITLTAPSGVIYGLTGWGQIQDNSQYAPIIHTMQAGGSNEDINGIVVHTTSSSTSCVLINNGAFTSTYRVVMFYL